MEGKGTGQGPNPNPGAHPPSAPNDPEDRAKDTCLEPVENSLPGLPASPSTTQHWGLSRLGSLSSSRPPEQRHRAKSSTLDVSPLRFSSEMSRPPFPCPGEPKDDSLTAGLTPLRSREVSLCSIEVSLRCQGAPSCPGVAWQKTAPECRVSLELAGAGPTLGPARDVRCCGAKVRVCSATT